MPRPRAPSLDRRCPAFFGEQAHVSLFAEAKDARSGFLAGAPGAAAVESSDRFGALLTLFYEFPFGVRAPLLFPDGAGMDLPRGRKGKAPCLP